MADPKRIQEFEADKAALAGAIREGGVTQEEADAALAQKYPDIAADTSTPADTDPVDMPAPQESAIKRGISLAGDALSGYGKVMDAPGGAVRAPILLGAEALTGKDLLNLEDLKKAQVPGFAEAGRRAGLPDSKTLEAVGLGLDIATDPLTYGSLGASAAKRAASSAVRVASGTTKLGRLASKMEAADKPKLAKFMLGLDKAGLKMDETLAAAYEKVPGVLKSVGKKLNLPGDVSGYGIKQLHRSGYKFLDSVATRQPGQIAQTLAKYGIRGSKQKIWEDTQEVSSALAKYLRGTVDKLEDVARKEGASTQTNSLAKSVLEDIETSWVQKHAPMKEAEKNSVVALLGEALAPREGLDQIRGRLIQQKMERGFTRAEAIKDTPKLAVAAASPALSYGGMYNARQQIGAYIKSGMWDTGKPITDAGSKILRNVYEELGKRLDNAFEKHPETFLPNQGKLFREASRDLGDLIAGTKSLREFAGSKSNPLVDIWDLGLSAAVLSNELSGPMRMGSGAFLGLKKAGDVQRSAGFRLGPVGTVSGVLSTTTGKTAWDVGTREGYKTLMEKLDERKRLREEGSK